MTLGNLLKKITDKIDAHDVDYVVAQGTSGIWTYRKWNSGIAECWGSKEYSGINVTETWGALYDAVLPSETFPSSLFISTPSITRSGISQAISGFFLATPASYAASSSVTGGTTILRPTGITNTNIKISYHAIGRWK